MRPTQRFSSLLAGSIWDVSMILYMGYGRLGLHATASVCLIHLCCIVGHHVVRRKGDHGDLKEPAAVNRRLGVAKARLHKLHRSTQRQPLANALQGTKEFHHQKASSK